MEKHTPGPWDVTGESYGGKYIRVQARESLRTVARVPYSNVPDDAPLSAYTDAADARLIAASPDLLAALKRALYHLEGQEYLDARAVIRDAIARAEGK